MSACELLKLRNHRWRSFRGRGRSDAAGPGRIRRNEHGLRREIVVEHRGASFAAAAVELVRVVSVGPFPKAVAHRLFEGGVADTSHGSGARRPGERGTRWRAPKVRSMRAPGDVRKAGVVELRALDGDAEAGLQPGCELEEPGLPGPGRPARAAGHVAPLVPPVVRCEDLDGRRFVGQLDREAVSCLGGDRTLVGLYDGGVAQALHEARNGLSRRAPVCVWTFNSTIARRPASVRRAGPPRRGPLSASDAYKGNW